MLLLLQASFIIGLVCSYFLAGWRVALGVQCLFGIILIVGMLFLPETPRLQLRYHSTTVLHYYDIILWYISIRT